MGVFSKIGSSRPSKSFFNLSYETKFDCAFNEIVPVLLIECVPGLS